MKNFINAIKNFFTSAWGLLLDYLHIAIPEETAILLNEVLSLADPIVQDLNNQNLTGLQKRDQAVVLIQAKASQAVLDMGIGLIHAGVELAVLKLKAAQPIGPVAVGGNMPGGEVSSPIPAV